MPSFKRQYDTMTECWRTAFRKHSTSIVSGATTCLRLGTQRVHIPIFNLALLQILPAQPKITTLESLNKITAGLPLTQFTLSLPPSLSTQPMTGVPPCRVLLNTNTLPSSNNPNDRTAGAPLRHQDKHLNMPPSRTILPAKPPLLK